LLFIISYLLDVYKNRKRELTKEEVDVLKNFVSNIKRGPPSSASAGGTDEVEDREGEVNVTEEEEMKKKKLKRYKNNKFDDGQYGTALYRSEYLEFLKRIRNDKEFVGFDNKMKSSVQGVTSTESIIVKLASNICQAFCCGLNNDIYDGNVKLLTDIRKQQLVV